MIDKEIRFIEEARTYNMNAAMQSLARKRK